MENIPEFNEPRFFVQMHALRGWNVCYRQEDGRLLAIPPRWDDEQIARTTCRVLNEIINSELDTSRPTMDSAWAKLARLAREATNGWACYAKRKIEHDDIARLHREIDAAIKDADVSPWQDIASAPKDGTHILLGWPTMVLSGYWADWRGRKSWVTARGEYSGEYEPTHWMALPPAPPPEPR